MPLQVTAKKGLVVSILVNFIGPILYFLLGKEDA